MPSDRTVRVGALVFAIFFAVVVVLGYIPGLNAQPHVHNPGMAMEPGEHMLLGLYTISLLDDVTHGLSAILFFVAALHSARASRLALTAFGWYYAYDAIIYLVTGVLQSKPLGRKCRPQHTARDHQRHHALAGVSGSDERAQRRGECPHSARTGTISSPRFEAA